MNEYTEITQEEIQRLEKIGLAMTKHLMEICQNLKAHSDEKEKQLSEAACQCQNLLNMLKNGGTANGR